MNEHQNIERLKSINIYSTGEGTVIVHMNSWQTGETGAPKFRDCPIGEVNSQGQWMIICRMAKFFGLKCVYLRRFESTTSICIEKAEALGLGSLCALLDEAS